MIEIRSVTFIENGGWLIDYVDSDDTKANGMVRMHALAIPPAPLRHSLREAIARMQTAVYVALDEALRDFQASPSQEEEEEDRPYDNPLER